MVGRTVALSVSVAALLAACGQAQPQAEAPAQVQASTAPSAAPSVKVLAAFYPYYWVAQRVGGPVAQVDLLTAPGVEPHDLELSPKQVQDVGEVNLVVYQKGFQPALDAAVDQRKPPQVLEVNTVLGREPVADEHTGEEGHGDEHGKDEPGHGEDDGHGHGAPGDLAADPHVWLDVDKLSAIATATADALTRVRPEEAAGFQTRAAQVRTDLAALDGEFRTGLTGCARDDVVVNHAAFGHLTARYRLTQIPVNGITPEAAPSPQRLAELAALIKREGATTVFTETLANPRLAETLAREAGVGTATLDPLEGLAAGDGRDFLSVMRDNLSALRAGLGCVAAAPTQPATPTETPAPAETPAPTETPAATESPAATAAP